jgi:hypothetical protein
MLGIFPAKIWRSNSFQLSFVISFSFKGSATAPATAGEVVDLVDLGGSLLPHPYKLSYSSSDTSPVKVKTDPPRSTRSTML